MTPEPNPLATLGGTELEVCKDIANRQAFGRTKYGTTVAENPLTLPEWLNHAYEEMTDGAIYLKRAMAQFAADNREFVTIASMEFWEKDIHESLSDAVLRTVRTMQHAIASRDAEIATKNAALQRVTKEAFTVAPGNETFWPAIHAAQADREALGRQVREIWVEWAKEQPNPKPSWLAPWEELSEPEKEVDRRIGERLAKVHLAEREAEYLRGAKLLSDNATVWKERAEAAEARLDRQSKELTSTEDRCRSEIAAARQERMAAEEVLLHAGYTRVRGATWPSATWKLPVNRHAVEARVEAAERRVVELEQTNASVRSDFSDAKRTHKYRENALAAKAHDADACLCAVIVAADDMQKELLRLNYFTESPRVSALAAAYDTAKARELSRLPLLGQVVHHVSELRRIAAMDTSQLASPDQCAAVAYAMDVLKSGELVLADTVNIDRKRDALEKLGEEAVALAEETCGMQGVVESLRSRWNEAKAGAGANNFAMRESHLRIAWEYGFRLCLRYGDNHAHFTGEQKEKAWAREFEAIRRVLPASLQFAPCPKNLHRLICEASGYVHDEHDWHRDIASLAEHVRTGFKKLAVMYTAIGNAETGANDWRAMKDAAEGEVERLRMEISRLKAAIAEGQRLHKEDAVALRALQEKERKHENDMSVVVAERDGAEDVINELCEAIGWTPEWSSAYSFNDAIVEAQERMATLSKRVTQAEEAAAERNEVFRRLGLTEGDFGALEIYVRERASVFDLIAHLKRQQTFSLRTFGPGRRTAGNIAHIRKELVEIEAKPDDLVEWIDVVLLAFDGALRHGGTPETIAATLGEKLARNEARIWPDWRTVPENEAITHTRERDNSEHDE